MLTNQEEAQRIVSLEILAAKDFSVSCANHGRISDKPLSYTDAMRLKIDHRQVFGCSTSEIDILDK